VAAAEEAFLVAVDNDDAVGKDVAGAVVHVLLELEGSSYVEAERNVAVHLDDGGAGEDPLPQLAVAPSVVVGLETFFSVQKKCTKLR